MTDLRHGLGIALVGWFIQQQFMRARRRLPVSEVRGIVRGLNAGEFGGWFREDDVLAIVQIESGFDPEEKRFEAHVKTPATPNGDVSIGLMQVLYSTALDRGHLGGPAALFDPVVNVRMGMRQLLWSHEFLTARLGRAPSIPEWIGSYNAGVGNVLRGNIPDLYVARWVRARADLSGG